MYVIKLDCSVTCYDLCLNPRRTEIEFENWDQVLALVENTVDEFLRAQNLLPPSSLIEKPPKSARTIVGRCLSPNVTGIRPLCVSETEDEKERVKDVERAE